MGYCITGSRFCKLIGPLQYMAGSEVTDNLSTELFKIDNGLINDWMGEKKIKTLEKSLECTQCQVFYSECISHGLLNLALNRWYGVELEPEEFNRILFQEDFIIEDVENELKKYAAKKDEGARES